MSSAVARALLVRGAAVRWPVRCALRAPGARVVQVGAAGWALSLRGFGSSVRGLREVGVDDGAPVEEETATNTAESDSTAASALSESQSGNDVASPKGEGSDLVAAATGLDAQTTSSSAGADQDAPVDDPWRPNFAFAFDIDGVLLHRSTPIPGATETLKYLQQRNIPFILLTNGGGKSEEERVAELSALLDVPLDVSQFVQSHTPYAEVAQTPPESPTADLKSGAAPFVYRLNDIKDRPDLGKKTILVLGSDASKARKIALGYGFKSVVTPGDILKAKPEIFPFDPLAEFYNKQEILPLPKPIYDPMNPNAKLEDSLKIDAILVFNDPRDWAVDIQLIVDLVFSDRGYLGTHGSNNASTTKDPQATTEDSQGQKGGQPILIMYSNSDMLWSTGYHLPRFGQGAFIHAVHNVVEGAKFMLQSKPTRKPVRQVIYGKPKKVTYNFASRMLAAYVVEMERKGLRAPKQTVHHTNRQLKRHLKVADLNNIYMVGDNPYSDIRGANLWNEEVKKASGRWRVGDDQLSRWKTCLVKSGVWREDKTGMEQIANNETRPDTVQDDVKSAVKWALEQEGWPEKLD